jgi:organic radical activating enzyme
MTIHAEVVSGLDNDVREFFAARRGAFGAMNLLPSHLPSDRRIASIVRHVMTVDYAISRVLQAPNYYEYLSRFAEETAGGCAVSAQPDELRGSYRSHLQRLDALGNQALAAELSAAARDTMETFNLFVPKQCNLSCRGCYAAAVPVTQRPYDDDIVEGFTSAAVSIIEQARACGAGTVYTSGDGEPTLFPRFFDLLEVIKRLGMQWLFFTAGLVFSSEDAAKQAWRVAQKYLQGPSRDRIARRLHVLERDGHPDPTVRALVGELAEYRENVQVYHSIWSSSALRNTEIRRPLIGDYRYQRVDSRGTELEFPSSLLTLMNEVFTDGLRERLGIEMPVSDIGAAEIPAVAAFVVDNGLRSYFEPTISTGRNRVGDLTAAPPASVASLAKLLVRTQCGFRNIHQPTIKYLARGTGSTFVASPGMGVDTADLSSMGVLDPLRIGTDAGAFFGAIHSPLMAYANYVHITGCKCDAFAARLSSDRAGITEQWRRISMHPAASDIRLPKLIDRLRGGDSR